MSSQSGQPRRLPRQERSRLMVRRIMDAGREVLVNRGYDGATTNLIAEVAGISPGSLYQYFPNKDVIIAAVIDDYTDDVVRAVTTHLVGQVGAPDDLVALRRTLDILLEAMEGQPEMLRTLVEHVPRLATGDKIIDFEQRVGELAMAHLRLRSATDEHSDTVVWIAVRAVEHLTIRYVLDRPSIERDEFLDELTALLSGYMAVDRRGPTET
jgi:AcrR family transcriptional regulator